MSCFIQSQWAPIAIASVYANNTSEVARIDKFEARNHDSVARTITIHIVANGSSPDDSTIRLTKSIEAGITDLCHAMVGHDLESGDAIYVLASVASMVSIRAGGRYV